MLTGSELEIGEEKVSKLVKELLEFNEEGVLENCKLEVELGNNIVGEVLGGQEWNLFFWPVNSTLQDVHFHFLLAIRLCLVKRWDSKLLAILEPIRALLEKWQFSKQHQLLTTGWGRIK